MEYKQQFVAPGYAFANVMPHSEVCISMRVAGKRMFCMMLTERSVQLFEPSTGQRFSAPILTGEAGIYSDNGQFYITGGDAQ